MNETSKSVRIALIDIHALSETLGVGTNTIYSWVSQNKIPHLKLGRLLRFDPHEIQSWLASRHIKSIEI